MRRPLISLLISLVFLVVRCSSLLAQAPAPTPNEDPTGNTGALKTQIQTAGSYDAHSGNATRIAQDLHLPGALGVYGLDFTRYWNSLHPDLDSNPYAQWPEDFGATGWSHSWKWTATQGTDIWQTAEGGGPLGAQYWETSITIGFPDGHTTKYKIVRSSLPRSGPPECSGRTGWGPPYLAQCGEKDWPPPGDLHDRLSDMAQDGSNFWLHLADGGSVHFVAVSGGYEATEVFDPHGLRTTLSYNADGLYRVEQEGGRWLDIIWDYRAGFPFKVIVQVQSGGYAGVQSVFYNYTPFSNGTANFLVLTSVDYPNDPGPGQTASAVYTYGFTYGDDPNGAQAPYPLLKIANDPRHPGAMTKIRYRYRGFTCPRNAPGSDPKPNYFRAFAEAIAAEETADTTPVLEVSKFSIDCDFGTRMETNGLNGWRMFYFGDSAGADPGTQGFHCLGYQLAKITDFTNQFPLPGNLPFEQQNYMAGQPRQVWDGLGILTELVSPPGDPTSGAPFDDSGQPSEIHHTGSGDGSVYYYDRINAGTSETRDSSRIHSPFNHWLYSQKDERGSITTYVRDSRMRVKDIIYPVTAEHFTYNDFNQVTSHTLPSGAVITYEYDPTTHRLLREYNSVDGWDARQEYTYGDPLHPLLYDDLVHTMTDGRARNSGAPYTVMMEYNGRNHAIKVHYAPTGAGLDPVVAYGYDPYGNCTSITDELGHASLYSYDAYRRCTRFIEPLNASDWKGTGIVSSRTWDWFYSRWIYGIGERDASAHTKNEWRIQIEPGFNAAGDRKMTARAHDLQNRIVVEETGWIQPFHADPDQLGDWYWSPTDGENHFFRYDSNGQKNYFRDPQGRETTYDYDGRNRLWKTNETVNSIPRTTETLYDTTGNKTLVKFPDLKTQQWLDYDAFGQAWTFIDERTNTTNLTYQWGPMKKLQTVTTHRVKDSGPGDWENQVTTFYYDLMGRPQWTIFPDGTSELTTYLFGQPDAFKTRKNQTKRLHYDARGREDYHTWDSDAAPRIDRTWDDASRLASITNIFSYIDFGYDDAGQIVWEGDEIAGSGGRTQTNYYRYPDGSIAHLHYPGGAYLRHDYTARGQLAATGWDDDDNNWWKKLAAYTYLQDGKVVYIDYGNGMRSAVDHDPRGFPHIVDHYNPGLNLDYSWRQYWRDSRDRITAFQKNYNPGANPMENGRGDRFAYDWEGQLTDGWYNALDPAGNFNSWTRRDHFTYDQLGNRQGGDNNLASRSLSSACTFFRRNNGLNQYSNWWPAGTNYVIYHDDNSPWAPWTSFPGNGVLMADGWLVASYNALNQPAAMIPFGWSDAIYFGYDPLGRCVKRWVGASGDVYSNPATYFHYDGSNLLQEGANAWGPARVYAHGNRVDEIVWSYNTFTGEQAFHHYDARGHCTLLTDSSGSILEQYEYDAFGQPYFYDANGNSIGAYDAQGRWAGYSQFGNRFLFTGREWLSDVKLYDYRNRMYQPELGRFMQPDPKEFGAGDYNLYRYCHNDPVNHTDPTGLDPTRDFIAGVGNALTFDQAEKVAEFFYPGYIASVDKSSAAYRFALPVGIAIGMADGTGEAGAAKAAAGKLFGSTSKVMAKVEKQLAEHGEKSLQKSLNSFEKRIAEHAEKIGEAKAAGGNTRSMEREVRAFEKERDAIKEVLKKKNE
jgi:RHS repeat-associated protein